MGKTRYHIIKSNLVKTAEFRNVCKNKNLHLYTFKRVFDKVENQFGNTTKPQPQFLTKHETNLDWNSLMYNLQPNL